MVRYKNLLPIYVLTDHDSPSPPRCARGLSVSSWGSLMARRAAVSSALAGRFGPRCVEMIRSRVFLTLTVTRGLISAPSLAVRRSKVPLGVRSLKHPGSYHDTEHFVVTLG